MDQISKKIYIATNFLLKVYSEKYATVDVVRDDKINVCNFILNICFPGERAYSIPSSTSFTLEPVTWIM
jgi:hypothetical protein